MLPARLFQFASLALFLILASSAGEEPSSTPGASGRAIFVKNCSVCHRGGGEGTRHVPPLNGSEWVQGDDRTLARILLRGLEGPIDVGGREFISPLKMPAFSQLSDEEIATVISYVRSFPKNGGAPVDARIVTAERSALVAELGSHYAERRWTAPELVERRTRDASLFRRLRRLIFG
ncbi:MAG: cytochrome c [Deltaproteobacteria bacterium]|nr:cytochrome c [Deltaproteobacteria bacterium]